MRLAVLDGLDGSPDWSSGLLRIPLADLASFLDLSKDPAIVFVEMASLDAEQKIEFLARIGRGNTLYAIAVERSSAESANHESLLRAGFAGVLDRECCPEIFQRAVRLIAEGQLWFPREIISRVLKGYLIVEDLDRLTSREVEILELIGDGLNNQQIANKLFISRETVRWHVRGLNSKLGIKDRNTAKEYLNHLQSRTPKFSNTSVEPTRQTVAG